MLNYHKDQLAFVIENLKNEKIEQTLKQLLDTQGSIRVDDHQQNLHQDQFKLHTLSRLTKEIIELDSSLLEEKSNQIRQKTYNKYLKLRFFRVLRAHTRQQSRIRLFKA